MEICKRCGGHGYVQVNVADFPDEPDFAEIACPNCSGTGQQPEPLDDEQRAWERMRVAQEQR